LQLSSDKIFHQTSNALLHYLVKRQSQKNRINPAIINSSQGSAATLFRCGGIFDYYFIINLLACQTQPSACCSVNRKCSKSPSAPADFGPATWSKPA